MLESSTGNSRYAHHTQWRNPGVLVANKAAETTHGHEGTGAPGGHKKWATLIGHLNN